MQAAAAVSPREVSGLVGIAQLAARGRALDSKSKVEYRELPSRSLLNRCANERMPFAWTINPYRGCEIGCVYCYARYTHEFLGLNDADAFERKIFAKTHAAAILRRDLASFRGGAIAIGTSTDPYQPAERRYGVTRSLLEVFAEGKGRNVSITTKSNLVLRDIDLLQAAAKNNRISVSLTVTTMDEALARRLEPRAIRPVLRLQAVMRLAKAGIRVGVFASPVLPRITDSQQSLDAIAVAAAAAGAKYFTGGSVFLMPSTQQKFFPFLEKEFPDLAEPYRRRFGQDAYLRGEAAERIAERIETARRRSSLPAPDRAAPAVKEQPPLQRTLFEP